MLTKNQLKIIVPASLVSLLWAICFPLIEVTSNYAPANATSSLRALMAGVVMILLAVIRRQSISIPLQTLPKIAAIGITATTIGFFAMFAASDYISPGLATVITNIQPLLAAPMAFLFLQERLTQRIMLGLCTGLFGIVLSSFGNGIDQANTLTGVVLLLISAISIATSNVLMKQIANQVPALSAMGWQLVLGSVPLFAIAFFNNDFSRVTWNKEFVFVLSILSVFGTAIAFYIWFRLMASVALNRLNAFTFLTPLFGLMIGYLFFSERLNGIQIVGVLVIFIGLYFVISDKTASN